jgi:stearoyl-CoA desaturase (Delta-9 desaturase)
MGEGYHNFHHQFPMDYRNAFLWYQYDPTKWFIALCSKIGLASHLRVFPSNEIAKGQLAMKLKDLKQLQDSIKWPTSVDNLPVVTWETCQFRYIFFKTELTDQYFLIVQEESKSRTLILIAGFIHDVSSFLDHHPGGRDHLIRSSGKEMTASFFGGVYTHSNAAHNVCMRITSLQQI